jgi:outer membrane receptor for Fe3+-dicitrate
MESGHPFLADTKAVCATRIAGSGHRRTSEIAGASLVNFDTGRVRPWFVFGWSGGMDLIQQEHFTLAGQLDIQNVANRDFAYNWGNPFSGTHFGYPRLISGSLKITFKK